MTICELQEAKYENARPLFRPMGHHLALGAILEGTTPAKIVVDDLANPKTAFTWTKHRFFLAGSEHNDEFNAAVDRLFTKTIYPQAIDAGHSRFVLYYSPNGWEDRIEVVLRGKSPVKHLRHCYTFKALLPDWRSLIPTGFAMRPVDGNLVANKRLKNLDMLTKEMQSERQSAVDFLDKSFGFCLVHGDEIVGWCLSEYNSENRCEVGIETVEGYRRQGVAALTASALVEHALSGGITEIGWHCWANNEGSIATARKVGFEKAKEYPVYFAWFRETHDLEGTRNSSSEKTD